MIHVQLATKSLPFQAEDRIDIPIQHSELFMDWRIRFYLRQVLFRAAKDATMDREHPSCENLWEPDQVKE